MGLLGGLFGGIGSLLGIGKKKKASVGSMTHAMVTKAVEDVFARLKAREGQTQQNTTPAPTNPEPPKPTPEDVAAKWREQFTGVKDRNRSSVDQILRSYGLNINDFNDQYNNTADNILNSLSVGSDVNGALNSDTIANQIVNNELRNRRTKYSTEANSAFGQNYGDDLIDDNALNSFVDEIIANQRKGADDYLAAGKARGIYNEAGLGAAMKAMSDQEQVGRANLSGLASKIIKDYESQGNSIRDKAHSSASGYNFGSSFNLNDFLSQGNKLKQTFADKAAGELKSAFGGTQLFDFSALNQKAGTGQGVTNLADSAIMQAMDDRQKKASNPYGVKSQGVF